MKIRYKARKDNDKPFRIQGLKSFTEEINLLPKGNYSIEVDRWRNKATPSQFAWLYGSIYPLTLVALNDAGYEFTNIDQVDMFWKALFANKDLLIRETGEIRKVPVSKSEFLTIDHMAYCSNIRNYSEEYLHVYIPDPEPNWKKQKELDYA
jgi:hypothetical protein